jgi:ATP-dependent Lon protease
LPLAAQAHALAKEVAELFRNVVQLSVKLKDGSVPEALANPPQLKALPPRELSFWVASLFAGSPYQVRDRGAGCGLA